MGVPRYCESPTPLAFVAHNCDGWSLRGRQEGCTAESSLVMRARVLSTRLDGVGWKLTSRSSRRSQRGSTRKQRRMRMRKMMTESVVAIYVPLRFLWYRWLSHVR